MSTRNESFAYAVSGSGSVFSLRSFSVSGADFWDAEGLLPGSLYSLLTGSGSAAESVVCIGVESAAELITEAIRVSAAVCTLYRIVEDKVSGFVAVVRRSWQKYRCRHRKSVFRRLDRCFCSSARSFPVLANAGGLRL